ncbi:MAG: Gfo/Idh/MocA family oxidoreductase [Chloroflexota bacterium]|nr:Gfo/Idh/MocA family oxidoreductase [Chloroflexota bacterium]
MDKLRVGIIGVGWPGQRHIEGYQKNPNAQIVALSDVNTEAAEKVRAEYSVDGARIYGDYREMLESPDVDAVSICTPNFLHGPMAIDALDAGKHVLLEKPLAHNLEEGERIAAKAASSDRALMIAFNNRYRPDSRVLKEQIEAGVLGDIYYAKTGWLRGASIFFLRGWFTQRARSGGGPLIDLGVHMLDLALWFMGNPRPVSVSGSVYHKFTDFMRQTAGNEADVEDLATAFVKLDNGATIVLDASWVSHIEQGDLVYSQLFGTRGGARIDRGGGEDLKITTTAGADATRTTIVHSPKFTSWQAQQPGFQLYESFRAEVADFVDSIRNNRQPGATITHGLDVLRVLDAIYRSAETGREVDLRQSTAADATIQPGEAVAPS